MIIDLFSRYVVGWMVAEKESKSLAAQLFAETVARHGIEPGLTVHSESSVSRDVADCVLDALNGKTVRNDSGGAASFRFKLELSTE